jgi:hypothetical protein
LATFIKLLETVSKGLSWLSSGGETERSPPYSPDLAPLLTVSISFMNVANSVLLRMAIILKANKVNLFVSSVLFVFWYHSPNILDTPRICSGVCYTKMCSDTKVVVVTLYLCLDTWL